MFHVLPCGFAATMCLSIRIKVPESKLMGGKSRIMHRNHERLKKVTLLRLPYCFFLFSPTFQCWGAPKTLFSICIHPLDDLIQIHYFKYHVYADDSQMLSPAQTWQPAPSSFQVDVLELNMSKTKLSAVSHLLPSESSLSRFDGKFLRP